MNKTRLVNGRGVLRIDLEGLLILETLMLLIFCKIWTMMFLLQENNDMKQKQLFFEVWFQTIPIVRNA